jgi:ArsR family transcriptional regulator
MERHAHRWPGFDDAAIAGWAGSAGAAAARVAELPGPVAVRLWSIRRIPAHASA